VPPTDHQENAMSRDDARAGADRQAAALAREVRGIIEALAVNDLGADALGEATELARELRRRLDGPARTRWYEGEDANSLVGSSRGAYLEQSPVRGLSNPVAPPLSLETTTRDDGSPAVRGHARLGRAYEGPPHGVHGGWVAALFDEVLGSLQGLAEAPGVTGVLKVRYRHVTPVDEDLRFDAWVETQRDRRLLARATCRAGDTLTADAEGLFVRVDWNEVQARMRSRRGD
jgi:acyl-coenzyme A thioesterase PaaI-like protein